MGEVRGLLTSDVSLNLVFLEICFPRLLADQLYLSCFWSIFPRLLSDVILNFKDLIVKNSLWRDYISCVSDLDSKTSLSAIILSLSINVP